MDPQLVSHYAQKFSAYDSEEISDLLARRSDLSDEASAGLDQALKNKGLQEADLYRPPPDRPTMTVQQAAAQLLEDTQRAKKLWRGGVATSSKLLMGLIFMAPVQVLLKKTNTDILWMVLLLMLLAAGYAGYWVGREVTRHICADAEVEFGAKRRRLWVLLATLVVAYFVAYAFSSSVFGVR